MLKHHAQNIDLNAQMLVNICSCKGWNVHICSSWKLVIIITTGQLIISDQLFCLSDYFSEIRSQIWLEIHYYSIMSGYLSWHIVISSTAYCDLEYCILVQQKLDAFTNSVLHQHLERFSFFKAILQDILNLKIMYLIYSHIGLV